MASTSVPRCLPLGDVLKRVFLLEEEDVIEFLNAIQLQTFCDPEWGLNEMNNFFFLS